MPVNPYNSQSISGYNASPPPDDGTQTSANKVEWAKHKNKIGDPIKTLTEAINSQCVAAFNVLALEDASLSTTTATVAEAGWHNIILQTATGRINYPNPANLENGWHNYIFNGSTGTVQLQATATSFFKIAGGSASEYLMPPGAGVKVFNTSTQYLVVGGTGSIPSGTDMLFYESAAPTGWTQNTAINDRVVRIVSGAGTGTGGSWTFSGLTVSSHTLTTSEMPAHTHTGTTSSDGNHAHDYNNSNTHATGFTAGGVSHDATNVNGTTTSAGAHTHTFTSDSTGGGGGHSHGNTHDGTWRPAHVDIIICTKD